MIFSGTSKPNAWNIATICALAVALLRGAPLEAHDSPEHVIEHLTARMDREGRSAELLYRRACEYRALGKMLPAERDLHEALKLQDDFLPAITELSEVQLAQGHADKALVTVEHALQKTVMREDQAALWIIRSDIRVSLEEFEAALADCQLACAERPDQVDWQLKRSYLRSQLAQHGQRADELKAGYEQTQSAVLKIEWVEALIDSGQVQAALAEIETELADCRWKSSWLLRRARAQDGLSNHSAAIDDLRAAILELDERINPKRPDPSLLSDRGLAYALLGARKAATRDLSAARAAGANPWMLTRLEHVLADNR